MTLKRRSRMLVPCLLAALGFLACYDDTGREVLSCRTWATEPEYEFGDYSLSSIVVLVADPDRGRLLLADATSAQVSAWTPDGLRLFEVGRRGEGPGDFDIPSRIHVAAEGSFYVRDGTGRRFTWFDANGGLVGTVSGPPGELVSWQGFSIRPEALLADGSFLANPNVAASIQEGLRGHELMSELPVLLVERPADRAWTPPEVVLWRTVTNETMAVQYQLGAFFAAQPFGDGDLVRVDAGAETIVTVRRNRGGGVIEVAETSAGGDVLWQRRLRLPARRIERQEVDLWVERFTDRLVSQGLSLIEARQLVTSAIFVPEQVPGVSRMVLVPTGSIWLMRWPTPDATDTLAVWYRIPRNETGPVACVVLPRWLRAMDVTDTHVWGVRTDELGVPHVVGRRLVEMPAGRE